MSDDLQLDPDMLDALAESLAGWDHDLTMFRESKRDAKKGENWTKKEKGVYYDYLAGAKAVTKRLRALGYIVTRCD